MPRKRVKRGGTYYRVCGPTWGRADDTSYSKSTGGRWNPKGEFGALYLNANLLAAHANAIRFIRANFGPTITPDDLQEAFLPELQEFNVKSSLFIDAVTPDGRAALGLPKTPHEQGDGYDICHKIARDAYAENQNGIASASAVADEGEELAIFDMRVDVVAAMVGRRKRFIDWYKPTVTPVTKARAPHARTTSVLVRSKDALL